jgi:glycosyltransferase involved in cell wall biosynthesis
VWRAAPDLPGRLRHRPGGRLWLNTIFTAISLAERPDVLFFPWSVLPRILVAPGVVMVHDVCFRTHPERFTDAGRRGDAQLRAAIRSATEVLTPSAASKREVVATYGVSDGRVTVVHHGIDPMFNPRPAACDADRLTRLSVGPRFFLGVSTHEPRKNLDVVVQAFVDLAEHWQGPGELPNLVLVGRRTWYTARLSELWSKSPSAAHHTTLIDSVSNADLAALYRQASVVLLPSVCEGFGFPALEALASGTPVVVSDLAVFRELLGDAAVYLPPSDVSAWASALRRACIDPELRVRAVDVSARLSQTFAWRTSALETLGVLERAARSRRRYTLSSLSG